jgi:hypothetical protein
MKRIIPIPGVGWGADPGTSSILGKRKGERHTIIVAKVSPIHIKVAFLESDNEERGNVCTRKKKTTDIGVAKNITPRVNQVAAGCVSALTAKKFVTLQRLMTMTRMVNS